MTYIFLAAGKGTRLKPLTLHYPKSLYRLDADTTVLDRAIRMIRKYDPDAEIVIVTGFMSDLVASHADRDTVVLKNPFYAVTNSIASLWFAREYLLRDDIVVINGNFALDAGLSPLNDAIFYEPADSDAAEIYANYVVVRLEDVESDWVEALRQCLCSEKVYEFMTDNEAYAGGVIPYFSLESAAE